MEVLKQIQKSFMQDASKLGEYGLLTKTELANGYCDAEEAAFELMAKGEDASELNSLRSSYYSALMLRYWHKIYEWIGNSASLHLEPSEFVTWLDDSLYVAFYYRTWRYEHEAIVQHGKFIDWGRDENGELIPNKYWYVNDPNAPDKIINRCCGSMRGRVYQYYNKDKRKADITAASVDQMLEDVGDSSAIYNGCYEDAPKTDTISPLINILLNRGNDIEALIIDGIAYRDSFKVKKNKVVIDCKDDYGNKATETITEKVNVFDSRRLVKHLTHIDPQFMAKFCEQYAVEVERGNEIYSKLQKCSNQKLYKCIEKTLIEFRQNPKLLSYIT